MGKSIVFRTMRVLLGAVFFVLCVAVVSHRLGLTSPSVVLLGIRDLWSTGVLRHDIEVTLARWAIGWSTGAMLGVGLGLLTGRSRAASLLLEGLLVLLRAIPFIALLPLSLRIFGLGEGGKVFLVGWASAGVAWVIVHHAARNLLPSVRWRALTLGVNPARWLFSVLLPSCSAGIYAALRTTSTLALLVVAVAEMGGVYQRSSGLWWSEGLGYRLFRSYDIARDDYLLGAMAVFAVLGLLVETSFSLSWALCAYLRLRLRQRAARRATARCSEMAREASTREWLPAAKVDLDVISAGYGPRSVVSGLSLSIAPGSTLGIIGPSGCGKTTLLRAIGHFQGDELQVAGTVRVAGVDRSTPGTWAGVVFQDSPVFEDMTVWDNVMFGKNAEPDAAWSLLSEFGLAPFAAERAQTLSGGQRQRLAVATAISNRPQLLLLDEPFGSLDAITRKQLQTFYRRHVRGRITAVFVTHDLTEALLVADQVAVGVGPNAKLLEVDCSDPSSGDWEFGPEFAELRRTAYAELERISDGSAEGKP